MQGYQSLSQKQQSYLVPNSIAPPSSRLSYSAQSATNPSVQHQTNHSSSISYNLNGAQHKSFDMKERLAQYKTQTKPHQKNTMNFERYQVQVAQQQQQQQQQQDRPATANPSFKDLNKSQMVSSSNSLQLSQMRLQRTATGDLAATDRTLQTPVVQNRSFQKQPPNYTIAIDKYRHYNAQSEALQDYFPNRNNYQTLFQQKSTQKSGVQGSTHTAPLNDTRKLYSNWKSKIEKEIDLTISQLHGSTKHKIQEASQNRVKTENAEQVRVEKTQSKQPKFPSTTKFEASLAFSQQPLNPEQAETLRNQEKEMTQSMMNFIELFKQTYQTNDKIMIQYINSQVNESKIQQETIVQLQAITQKLIDQCLDQREKLTKIAPNIFNNFKLYEKELDSTYFFQQLNNLDQDSNSLARLPAKICFSCFFSLVSDIQANLKKMQATSLNQNRYMERGLQKALQQILRLVVYDTLKPRFTNAIKQFSTLSQLQKGIACVALQNLIESNSQSDDVSEFLSYLRLLENCDKVVEVSANNDLFKQALTQIDHFIKNIEQMYEIISQNFSPFYEETKSQETTSDTIDQYNQSDLQWNKQQKLLERLELLKCQLYAYMPKTIYTFSSYGIQTFKSLTALDLKPRILISQDFLDNNTTLTNRQKVAKIFLLILGQMFAHNNKMQKYFEKKSLMEDMHETLASEYFSQIDKMMSIENLDNYITKISDSDAQKIIKFQHAHFLKQLQQLAYQKEIKNYQ